MMEQMEQMDQMEETKMAMMTCRCCLAFGEASSVAPMDASQAEGLLECAGVEVRPEDGLPCGLCVLCREDLVRAGDFKARCRRSDALLRQLRFGPAEGESCDPCDFFVEEKVKIEFEPIEPEGKPGKAGKYAEYTTGTGKLRRYHCKECPYITPHLGGFKFHMYSHGDPLFRCRECKEKFVEKADLERHRLQHAKVCSACGKTCISLQMLKLHEATHDLTRRYVCDLCNKAVRSKRTLIDHMKRHRDKRFPCRLCGLAYISQSELNRHAKTHSDSIEECHLCDFKCRSRTGLKKHLCTHTEHIEPENPPDGAVQIKIEYEEEENVEKAFIPRKESKYSRYITGKGGDKIYNCDKCPYTGTRVCKFAIHMRSHTGEKPYVCGVCGKSFKRSSGLSRHRTVHTEDKPFVCSVCNKPFKSREKLSIHEKTHDMVIKYVCDLCGKGFKTRDSIVDHLTRHYNIRKHPCDLCPLSFCSQNDLGKHRKVHFEKGLFCHLCDYRCHEKRNLKQHMLRHTVKKEFECDACPSSFNTRRRLMMHKISRHGSL